MSFRVKKKQFNSQSYNPTSHSQRIKINELMLPDVLKKGTPQSQAKTLRLKTTATDSNNQNHFQSQRFEHLFKSLGKPSNDDASSFHNFFNKGDYVNPKQTENGGEQFINKVDQVKEQLSLGLEELFYSVDKDQMRKEYFLSTLNIFEEELAQYLIRSITDSKTLVDKYFGYQSAIIKLIKVISGQLQELQGKYDGIEKRFHEKIQEIEQLKNHKNTLAEMVTQLQKTEMKQFNNVDEFKLRKQYLEFTKKHNELSMENMRLKNEQERLREKLIDMESKTDVQNLLNKIDTLEIQHREKQMQLMLELEQKDKQINKVNIMFQNIKSQYQKLENEAKIYNTVLEQNQNQINILMEENEKYKLSTKKLREIAQMEMADKESRITEIKEILMISEKAKDKLQRLQQKFDRMQIEKSKQIEAKNNEEYEEDVKKLSDITQTIGKDQSYFKIQYYVQQEQKQHLAKKGLTVSISDKFNFDSYFSADEINLDKYNAVYGSFLQFIDHRRKTLESELQNIQYHKTSITFFPTIRQILDAKWREMLVCDQPEHYSRFPEFVYSWVSNFTVDQGTKQVRELDSEEIQRSDDIIIKLLIDLNTPNVLKNWECKTFGEFLFDKSSQDELFFYLYCRNLLFRGPQCNYISSSFEGIHYLPLIHTEFVVDILLHQYENNSIQQLKRALRERSIKKNMSKHIYIIDSGFALRVFLEFYRGERKNRYKLLKQSMQSLRQINFKNFKKIILSNYPKSTDLEIATLFRESSAYGQVRAEGVNIDTFFTAASESGFFIKHLNFLSQCKKPRFEEDKLLYDQSNLEYINFMQAYERLYNNRTRIKQTFIDFGSEQLMKEFYELIENGADKQFKDFNFREKNFPQKMNYFFQIMQKLKLVLHSEIYLQEGPEFNEYAQKFIKSHSEKMKQLEKGNIPKNQPYLSTENFYLKHVESDNFIKEYEMIQTMIPGITEFVQIIQQRENNTKQ